jgi:hypothetical protein
LTDTHAIYPHLFFQRIRFSSADELIRPGSFRSLSGSFSVPFTPTEKQKIARKNPYPWNNGQKIFVKKGSLQNG